MTKAWAAAGLMLVLIAQVRGDETNRPRSADALEQVTMQPPDPKAKEPPKGQPKELPKPKEPKKGPEPDAFARGPDMGGEAPAGSFSRMMGDWVGAMYADRIVQLPGFVINSTPVTGTQTRIVTVIGANGVPQRVPITTIIPLGTTIDIEPALVTTRARVAVVSGGSFKIAENERPIPEDRVFFTYNYFQDVPGAMQTPSLPIATTANGPPGLALGLVPPYGTYVQREVFGFEKTFLDGMASFGMRAPFVQQQGGIAPADSFLGDLSFIFKAVGYSFGSDAVTGGLVLTVPTGPGIQTVDGDIHPFLFQPWVGGVATAGNFFAIGFASVVIPTDDRYPTMLFTDLQVGVVAYQNPFAGLVTYVAPISEIHMTNPLNHRDQTSVLAVPDLVVLTEGVQVGIGPAASVSIGVAVPITGPRPFDWEALVQFNLRF